MLSTEHVLFCGQVLRRTEYGTKSPAHALAIALILVSESGPKWEVGKRKVLAGM